jgi:superfamily II DNA or RNA helicase
MDVQIEVGATRLKISPRLPLEDSRLLRKRFTYVMHNYQFTTQHKLYGWDGRKTVIYKDQTAPAGCLYRIRNFLEEKLQHDVEVTYKNDYKPCGTIDIYGFELKTFQKQAIKRIVKYRRGIIQAPVRAGKTAIAAAAIKRIGHYPAWLITYGKDLVHQTRKDLEYHLQMPVGVFSEGKYSDGKVIVTSYQAITRAISAAKKKKEENAKLKDETKQRNLALLRLIRGAKVFIFDECHHALAPKNRDLLGEMQSAGYVMGLSGTPKPDDTHYLELEAAIGAVIFKVKYETLIKHGRIARPMITIYKMPYRWYTTGLKEFSDVYDSNVVQNLYRNRFIADVVKHLYKSNKTAFVMIRKLDHGPILRALIPGSVFVQGKISSEIRAELYQSLQSKAIHCIVATVGKEGLNIPKLDAVVNAEGYKSSVTTMQKMRSLTATEGKKYGIIVDFMDRGKFLGKHSKARERIYKKMGNIKLKVRQVPADFYKMEGTRWVQ